MEFSTRWQRSFLFIGAMLAASLQGNAAFAGCMDGDYIKKAFAAQKTVKICRLGRCRTVKLSRLCSNIDYSSADYKTNTEQWLFRIRFHGDGVEDDEFSVLLNGQKITAIAAKELTCKPKRGSEGCEIINGVLNNMLTE